jgi:D-alanyl-D-alanine dipeptidase
MKFLFCGFVLVFSNLSLVAAQAQQPATDAPKMTERQATDLAMDIQASLRKAGLQNFQIESLRVKQSSAASPAGASVQGCSLSCGGFPPSCSLECH